MCGAPRSQCDASELSALSLTRPGVAGTRSPSAPKHLEVWAGVHAPAAAVTFRPRGGRRLLCYERGSALTQKHEGEVEKRGPDAPGEGKQ